MKAFLVRRKHLFENYSEWNEKDIMFQGEKSSEYRHSINMYTAFLKNCEILNAARQSKIV